jgi:MFS transporter, DHA2 family, multidrug resistance protein
MILQERVATITHYFPLNLPGDDMAERMAVAKLAQIVRREALVMAYSDCFFIVGICMLLGLLAVVFLRRPPRHFAMTRAIR